MDGLYKELKARQLIAVRGGAAKYPYSTGPLLEGARKPKPSSTLRYGWMADPHG
jgi:hypothetical protein